MVKLRESGENYLENIFILMRRNGDVRSVDLANELDFSKPSVSRAVHLLEDQGLIKIQNNSLITLTEEGHKRALDIYEKHVFLTKFFMAIGVPEDIAAVDACRIEHVLSDETYKKWNEHAMHFFSEPDHRIDVHDQAIFDFNRRALRGEIEANHEEPAN